MIRREKTGENLHMGHRQRMRNKLLNYGQSVFETYELLEMLLYTPIKRGDTNPQAKRLFKKFSNIENIFSADESELLCIDGIGAGTAAFLKNVGYGRELLSLEYSGKREKYETFDKAGRLAVEYFKGCRDYKVSLFLFDNNMRLISINDICDKDYQYAAVRPLDFIDCALRARASVAIIAHTHPHGPFCPSPGDMETNRLMVSVFSDSGVFCAEHYVVCGDSYYGIISNSARDFAQAPDMQEFFRKNIALSSSPVLFENEEGVPLYDDGRLKKYLASLIGFNMRGADAEPLAEKLLIRYGNLLNIFSASENELCDMHGFNLSTAVFFKTLAELFARCTTDKFAFGKICKQEQLTKYLIALFIGKSEETIYVCSFDEKERFLACDFVGEGTVNSAGIIPRKLVEVAIKRKAKNVVVAHNHPGGVAKSSSQDCIMTTSITSVLSMAGIRLTAHYIIAGKHYQIIKTEFTDN